MAARLRRHHQDDVRQKIQASQIVNRLQAHGFGEVELSATQVQALRILLDKAVSNAPQDQNIRVGTLSSVLDEIDSRYGRP